MEQLTVATESPADRIVRVLHPWSSYVVLPIFALANAGVPLASGAARAFRSPVAQGVVLGLILGKLLGICLFAYLAIRLHIANTIPVARWTQMVGIGLLGGIGFTVSLFITDLAFTNPAIVTEAKLGVLVASLVAGAAGYSILRFTRDVSVRSSTRLHASSAQ